MGLTWCMRQAASLSLSRFRQGSLWLLSERRIEMDLGNAYWRAFEDAEGMYTLRVGAGCVSLLLLLSCCLFVLPV